MNDTNKSNDVQNINDMPQVNSCDMSETFAETCSENVEDIDDFIFEVDDAQLVGTSTDTVTKYHLTVKSIIVIVSVLLCLLIFVMLIGLLCKHPETHTEDDTTATETETAVTEVTDANDDEAFMQAFYEATETDAVQGNGLTAPVEYYTIDRQKLTAIENCVGYIDIAGTYVSDFVVQANDNSFYLDTNEYGSPAENGAVFGDYRNNFDTLNLNNIIYAHNMADGSRFGTLQRLNDTAFYADDSGAYIPCNVSFDSMCYNNVFRVYSVYEIDLTTFNYIRTAFTDADDFTNFVAQTRSYNNVPALETEVIPAETKILTLSTCTAGGSKRLVVHAYLYAREVC